MSIDDIKLFAKNKKKKRIRDPNTGSEYIQS